MKRLPGKKLFNFHLFGSEFQVREVGKGHKVFDQKECEEEVKAIVYLEKRIIYLQSRKDMTLEQQQTALMHEIEHIIEDHFHITNHDDETTDQIALGWLYFIRGCPDIVKFCTKKDDE